MRNAAQCSGLAAPAGVVVHGTAAQSPDLSPVKRDCRFWLLTKWSSRVEGAALDLYVDVGEAAGGGR